MHINPDASIRSRRPPIRPVEVWIRRGVHSGLHRTGLGPDAFGAAATRAPASGTPEIGYGVMAGFPGASRAELDALFARMNAGP